VGRFVIGENSPLVGRFVIGENSPLVGRFVIGERSSGPVPRRRLIALKEPFSTTDIQRKGCNIYAQLRAYDMDGTGILLIEDMPFQPLAFDYFFCPNGFYK
jgi:hypothetical protein